MDRHPGGEAHTRYMLEKAGLTGGKILDMGAGAGDTVRLLRNLGYQADGIDLCPKDEIVQCGNLLATGMKDQSYDAVISQCSFYVSGDVAGAMAESYRLLKAGGMLLMSDICFEDVTQLAESAGYHVNYQEDLTPMWKEYYIEAIWNGTADYCKINGKGKYLFLVCQK